MAENNYGRKNDTVILGTLSEMKITLALLIKGQEDTNAHLMTLNGKVVVHENRLNDQTLVNQQTITSLGEITKRLTGEDKEKKESSEWKKSFADKASWAAFALVMVIFYKVLVATGLISNFLNK